MHSFFYKSLQLEFPFFQDFYDFTVQVEKQVTDCDSENKQSAFECIEKFLASKVDCLFPWLDPRNFSNLSKTVCNKTEDLKKHLENQFQIYRRTMDDELKAFGCLLKNCMQKTWQPRLFSLDCLL